jgi:hypothetical protein
MRRSFLILCLVSACVLLGTGAEGQVFRVQAGASSMYDAQGGGVEFQAPGYDGWMGIGWLDGHFTLGANVRTEFHGLNLTAGDQTLKFELPTDVFGTSYHFLARGVGVSGSFRGFEFKALGGVSSTGAGTPFFRGARRDRNLGLLFADRQVSPSLRLSARTVISDRQTSIAGFEYKLNPWLTTALAAGMGGNEKIFASSLVAEKGWMSLKAGYSALGDEFRRVTARAPLNAEVDRDNVLLTLRPRDNLTITAGREHLLSSNDEESGAITVSRARVHSLGASYSFAGVRLGTSFYDTVTDGFASRAFSVSAGRAITRRVDVSGGYFRSDSQAQSFQTINASVRENITRRIRLLQVVNRAAGQTSFSFGGDFESNKFAVGVSYQTVYVPFRPEKPFVQAMAVNLRLQPWRSLQVQLQTAVAPDGSVRYTGYGSDYFYRYAGLQGPQQRRGLDSLKYLVRGRVTDEAGLPISGAALQVDGELVFTNAAGEFFVRLANAGPHSFRVVMEEFLTPGTFEVISAPAQVMGKRDDAAGEVHVILRRIVRSRRGPAPNPPQAPANEADVIESIALLTLF